MELRRTGRLEARVLANLVLEQGVEGGHDPNVTQVQFPGADTLIPAATFSRCLAQKLLRYSNIRSGGRINTRWTDLQDFLLAANSPPAGKLHGPSLLEDVKREFAVRRRSLPSQLPRPPLEWLDFWDTATFEGDLPFGDLQDAVRLVDRFWTPILQGATVPHVWNPSIWTWN